MRHAIAALHAERLEHVGELADLAIQIEVGQRAAVARLAFPDDRGLVPARPARVAIDAVDARVQRAADEPLRMRRLPVEHLRPRREPLQLRGESGPERLRIALRRARRHPRRARWPAREMRRAAETSGLPGGDRRARATGTFWDMADQDTPGDGGRAGGKGARTKVRGATRRRDSFARTRTATEVRRLDPGSPQS